MARLPGALWAGAHHTFRPGPVPEGPLDSLACARRDRIYEITRADLSNFNTHRVLATNLRDWPAHLGAPVVDGDGNPATFDPAAGDRPELLGDQMYWWVMYDDIEPPDGDPIPGGLEIQTTAFVYHRPGALDNAVFFRYRFINRTDVPLDDFHFALSPETEMGNAASNFVGADTTRHMAYVYHGRPELEGFGVPPTAMGFVYLPAPEGFAGLSSFTREGYWRNDMTWQQALSESLHGRWSDGTPMRVGGDGRDGAGPVTRFLFPGDPVSGEGWSGMNVDGRGGRGSAIAGGTRITTGPFRLAPGEARELRFAVVWAEGEGFLDAVVRLRAEADHLREAAAVLFSPDPTLVEVPGVAAPPPTLAAGRNYPNPFTDRTTIAYRLPQPMAVRLEVFDALGRRRALLVDERQETGTYEVPFDGGALPPGVYFYRLRMDHLEAVRPMVRMR